MSMAAASLIECAECGGTDFYRRDGLHVCRRCNQESRDHGIETTVDDESFGVFSVASTLRKRSLNVNLFEVSKIRRDR